MRLLFIFGVITIVCYVEGFSFIKGKNVPRVGRSNEAEGMYDSSVGYVIKTIPSKNIPRMGRRNYDSKGQYDIPKFYQLPLENPEMFEEGELDDNQEKLQAYFGNSMDN